MATILVSLTYGVLDIVFTMSDIRSAKTKQSVTSGLFVVLITVIWYSDLLTYIVTYSLT